ncbi:MULTISPECIES: hypothetical protein [unclassified Pseudactinotalea]|uniref:hypothetical protein n=1 Tax=unclassified Pseudactinotalea TaxID=2649176 RepID=UPI00128E0E13|nr:MULTISPECIES: hypothetical protein [unclassified Pseudactinotalea]MPV50691.1 hypothetical protein [Pseudactinotalea sp. HY160]QGH70053.1 hypothetical protein GCE65_11465 [Pseudactinotalea sp. HY158]
MKDITCTVTAVDSWRNSGRRTSQGLSIYSSNCPTIAAKPHVSKEEQDALAAGFELGRDYTFTVGGFAYFLADDLGWGAVDLLGELPTEPAN